MSNKINGITIIDVIVRSLFFLENINNLYFNL
jgi:hypothetical protein